MFEVSEVGLHRVLSEWSGIGSLYEAISEIEDASPAGREWTPEQVHDRAMRILLLDAAPILAQFPSSQRAWRNYLPVLSQKHRYWSPRPESRVDWARTARRGWPPEAFAIRRRHRTSDDASLSFLAWTFGRLEEAVNGAKASYGGHTNSLAELVSESAAPALGAALELFREIDLGDPAPPSAGDYRAVYGLGWPWTGVVDLARVLNVGSEANGLRQLSERLLSPEGFPETLFQLSVLGDILVAAQQAGYKVTSLRPIGQMTTGPVYAVEDARGSRWELWCEAASCWEAYGADDHYMRIARDLYSVGGRPFTPGHLRPDLLLALPGHTALVIECKFPWESQNPSYVASGIPQAGFYARQLAPAFENTGASIVGPAELTGSNPMGSAVDGILIRVDSPDALAQRVLTLLHRGESVQGSLTESQT